MKKLFCWTVPLLLSIIPAFISAGQVNGDPEAPIVINGPVKPTKGALMDYGTFLSSSLSAPAAPGEKPKVIAYKSFNIKLGHGAHVSFDTELMRYAAGWTGEWLDLKRTHMTTAKGEVCVGIAGHVVFSTAMAPGVSHRGSLVDPRNDPAHPHRGPLPKEHAHYTGLYLSGDRVVITYSAGGGRVLELPGAGKVGESAFFTRTLRVEKTSEPLTIVLADDAAGLSAALVKEPVGAEIVKQEGTLRLNLPAVAESEVFTIVLGTGDAVTAAKSLPVEPDPLQLTHGGRARWKDLIETRGELAVSPKAD